MSSNDDPFAQAPAEEAQSEHETAEQPEPLACPHCGQEVDAARGALAYETHCPSCGEGFVVPAADGSTVVPDADAQELARRREEELSSIRMRQISATRRAAIRSQTYCIVGAGLCIVGLGQLIFNAVFHIREKGWGNKPLGYILVAVAAFIASIHLVARARHWNRQSHVTALEDPTAPPDFSALSDGSQKHRDLEDVR